VQTPQIFRLGQKRGYKGRGHQAGRAAAKEDALQCLAARHFRLAAQVGQERTLPQIMVNPVTHVAVKVAIGAFLETEGPVDIKCARHAFFTRV
jgi:hypothetical protein